MMKKVGWNGHLGGSRSTPCWDSEPARAIYLVGRLQARELAPRHQLVRLGGRHEPPCTTALACNTRT